jgi:hypothetical protein
MSRETIKEKVNLKKVKQVPFRNGNMVEVLYMHA